MAEAMRSDPLEDELERRLDQLFPEDGPPPPETAPRKGPDGELLAELKKVVLSIDWEITPEAVAAFVDQVRLLKEALQEDRVAGILLNMLAALGYYIQSSRSQVHPWTFPVLNAVFARLEEVTALAGAPEAERRRRIQPEINAYQQLRDKIAQGRGPRAKAAPPTAGAEARPTGPPVTAEMLERAVAELKELIRDEVRAVLRAIETKGRMP